MCGAWVAARAQWLLTESILIKSSALPILPALLAQLVLGIAVFQANPRRKANQSFLLLSLTIVLWLASLYKAFSAATATEAEQYIRAASMAAAFIITAAEILRLSIQKWDRRWAEILRDSWVWFVSAGATLMFCQSKLFLAGARFSQPAANGIALAVPVYGSAAFLYVIYFAVGGSVIVFEYARDMKRAAGIRRAELSFILTGAAVCFSTVLVAFLLGFFIDRARLVWFAPFRVVVFSLIVGYGIATQKIMDVGFFLRRSMSYILLTLYLMSLYGAIWWLVHKVCDPIVPEFSVSIAHLSAALVVAFAMSPARGVSQKLADRLFVTTKGLDFRSTVQKAAAILESITTVSDLLTRFGSTVAEALGTDHVSIYLSTQSGFVERYRLAKQASIASNSNAIPADDPLVGWLQSSREPLVLDELYRVRVTPTVAKVMKRLQDLEAVVAVGIFARDHLVGLTLLGDRVSGRIYGGTEQDALKVLCRQLSVAIDNAQLFTEVQNARIYNETLLQNLTTGVIAADANGRITVLNNEAVRIIGWDAQETGDRTVGDLPIALGTILKETLQAQETLTDREISFRSDGNTIIARASSSIFHDQKKQLLGALVVVTDITALKRLEFQIRRSDRLASLGTLSAGMAHEIKNPLVSIKTFTQLLPERYDDSEFRDTFSNLISHEIDRIDSLVNQLLRFARPAKPLLRPAHLHEILEKTLLLVQHRLYQREIKLVRSFGAETDMVRADSDQLEQVFLNFFLNALDAMKGGGELTVKTKVCGGEIFVSDIGDSGPDGSELLHICICDTGDGIKAEDLPHVFDPFFTTKDYGTGLGLSVVHGIIQEHGGQIEVESELKKGTSFHIYLPLVRSHEEAVVA